MGQVAQAARPWLWAGSVPGVGGVEIFFASSFPVIKSKDILC